MRIFSFARRRRYCVGLSHLARAERKFCADLGRVRGKNKKGRRVAITDPPSKIKFGTTTAPTPRIVPTRPAFSSKRCMVRQLVKRNRHLRREQVGKERESRIFCVTTGSRLTGSKGSYPREKDFRKNSESKELRFTKTKFR